MSEEKDEIVQWLSQQQQWLQEAALRLLTKGGLSDADYADIMKLVKTPLSPDPVLRKFPSIVGGAASAAKSVRLQSIGPVLGIDRLAPSTPLDFGSKPLVVVYGGNGAGKSGYVRILKKVSGKPNSQALKHDVFSTLPSEQSCTFSYTIDGNPTTDKWDASSNPLEDLRCLDIFDSVAARFYLENEGEATYTPPAVALFEDLVKVADKLRAALTSEKEKLVSKLSNLPQQYAGTKAGKFYDKISPTSTPAEIKSIDTFMKEDTDALESVEARLKTKDPAASARKKREEKVQIGLIKGAIRGALNNLTAEKIETSNKTKDVAAEKRRIAIEAAEATNSKSKLDGIGKETWKSMWEAARLYSEKEAYPEALFPFTGEGSRCVLCHQDLDGDAKVRLTGFETFVTSTMENNAVVAEKAWTDLKNALPIRPSPEILLTALQAGGLESATWAVRFEDAWTQIEAANSALASGSLTEFEIEPLVALVDDAEHLEEKLEMEALQLDEDAKQFDRQAAAIQKVELEAKRWTAEQKTQIADELARQKNIAQYGEWFSSTSTTGISRKATAVADKFLTQDYVDRFNKELDALGARHISVELAKLPTQRGKARYKVYLKGVTPVNAGPNQVLSDGEQRIVALAAFLADVGNNAHTAPFIFDDPISSLDYDYEKYCVQRLIELSQVRQVIIFTHRLSLVSHVCDSSAAESDEISIRSFRGASGQPSALKPYSGKPDKALNILRQDSLGRAKKCHDTEGYDAYYPLGRAICSELRTIVEKSVEVILIDGIVHRFRKNIMTGSKKDNKLSKLLKIQLADCVLIEEFMTKYSGFEHSSADDTPVEIPLPDEVAADMDRLIEWFKEFSKRPVPSAIPA